VVCLNTIAIADILAKSGAAIMTGPNPGDVAQGVIQLLTSEERWGTAQAAALRAAAEDFSRRTQLETLTATYEDAVRGRQAA
jgi:hypothetical protein